MARSIRYIGFKAFGLAQLGQDPIHNPFDALLYPIANVIQLADPALLQNQVDRATVVGDKQPFAPIGAAAVERQRFIVEGVRDKERDQLSGN